MTIDDVRAMALALPDTTERPSYGTPGFRVRDTLFARVLDDKTVVIKVDFDHRDLLVTSAPDVFEVTAHYLKHPMVIVHLEKVRRPTLCKLLADAHRFATTAR